MTPWVAILAVFGFAYTVSMAILYTGRYLLLVNMAAAAECIIYVLCAAAVMVLRKKMADTPRAFKVPGGSTIPVLTILIFSILAVIVIATDYVMAIWMAVGLLIIGLYSIYVVPKIKAKYKPQRVRRRRERHPAPVEEPRTGPAADPTASGAEKSKAI
jgi:amino acid transporter